MTQIYFIQSGEFGPIKIGSATSVAKRMIELQCGNHEKLLLRAEIAASQPLEKSIHRVLSSYRVRGEWFKPGHSIDSLIGHILLGKIDASNLLCWLEKEVSRLSRHDEARRAERLIQHWQATIELGTAASHVVETARRALIERGPEIEAFIAEADKLRPHLPAALAIVREADKLRGAA